MAEIESKGEGGFPESWAILEIMGHRQRAGRVSECEMFGGKLLRIDIPTRFETTEGAESAHDGYVTEFYGCASVYALRPCGELVARDFARTYVHDLNPVRPMVYREREAEPDYPKLGPAAEPAPDADDDGRPF